MKILAIETATQVCAVAITDNNHLVAEYRLNLKNVHAERLFGIIKKLLDDVPINLPDLAAVAVSSGPGSFTGLRIGVAAAKGLAFANDIPLVSVPTLDALAMRVPVGFKYVCPVLHAYATKVYAALYRPDNFTMVKVSAETILEIAELENFIQPNTAILGNVFDRFEINPVVSGTVILPDYYGITSAFMIARLAGLKLVNNEIENVASFEPFYLQDFVAGEVKSN